MNQQNFRAVTQPFANAGFVAGTTSTYTTTAATKSAIKGVWGTDLAAQTNTATPTVDAATGLPFIALQPNQVTVLVFGVTAAGAIQMIQGDIQPSKIGVTTTPGDIIVLPQFPVIPDTVCPHAYTVIRTAPSAAPWTPGTSSWTASGVVATTFRNVQTLPDRPAAS